MTRRTHRLAALLPLFAVLPAAAQGAPRTPPSLVVLISIDQMRADYLDRFGGQLTGGLARLARGGARYTNAHHDHAITETAPGHATLLAGRFPRSTGIAMNRVGVEDDSALLIGGGIGTGASPKRFIGTTLVDWLAAGDPRSRALSVSAKDRAAILPVGRSRTDVYWYSPNGRFTTSRYYRDTLPAWVIAFNARRMPMRYTHTSWKLLLPDTAYHERDSVAVEGNGTFFEFPHDFPEDSGATASLVRGTPFIDDVTLAFALHGLKELSLGSGPQTDVLSISLSATDYIGHRYGPDSREIHDQVVRLDRTLGAFLDSLFTLRDSSRVTIALTGDHGVATIPEIAPSSVQPPPTRVTLWSLWPALRDGLLAAKVDTMAVDIDVQIVNADRAAFAKAGVNADSVLRGFAAAARQLPGVKRVDWFRDLPADTATDPIARRWSHQFPATAPIDLVVTLQPGSTWRGNIASHGSPYDYDTNVPLIFYGAGIVPGKHAEFVRTVDLAPTLAAVAGVKPLEKLDGVVLQSAVRH